MCGIIGILGTQSVDEDILQTLQRLEYRGYDSAGIATQDNQTVYRQRVEGKLIGLSKKLALTPLPGHMGIGHTRWATHGAPTQMNAHPHKSGPVYLVHNGIIENHEALRAELTTPEISLSSDTDTEVVTALIHQYLLELNDPIAAFSAILKKLQGAFALVVMFEGKEDLLLAARRGSPLVIAQNGKDKYLGSDAIAIGPFSDKIIYLDEGDWTIVRRSGIKIFNSDDIPVQRELKRLENANVRVDKGNHPHFMYKEILEQAEMIPRTLASFIDTKNNCVKAGIASQIAWQDLQMMHITACGTALFSGMVARYWFESLAKLPVIHDVASEFRYRNIALPEKGLTCLISQSGETADTYASLLHAKESRQTTLAIVNVENASMTREADHVMLTLAGPEIGVASSKAFTCQLGALAGLVLAAAKARNTISSDTEAHAINALGNISTLLRQTLALEDTIINLAKKIHNTRSVLYLGRGMGFPLALEGALKLKELAYIHAEGYPAGELKHGPIALVDSHLPSIMIAPYNQHFEKSLSNIQEIKARSGPVYLLTDQKGADLADNIVDDCIILPQAHDLVWPILYAIPLQLLAYHSAKLLGTDIDQPRNLAKSVTVE